MLVSCSSSVETEYDDDYALSSVVKKSSQIKCEQLERDRREALLQEVSRILKKWSDIT